MSVQAMSWVFAYSKARLADRLVMLALGDEANPTGLSCYPGQRLISEHSLVARSSVRRVLLHLEAGGEILIWRPERQGRGHHSRYAIVGGRGAARLGIVLGWPISNLDDEVMAEFGNAPRDGAHPAALPDPTDDDLKREPFSLRRGSNPIEKGPPIAGPNPLDPDNPYEKSAVGEEEPDHGIPLLVVTDRPFEDRARIPAMECEPEVKAAGLEVIRGIKARRHSGQKAETIESDAV